CHAPLTIGHATNPSPVRACRLPCSRCWTPPACRATSTKSSQRHWTPDTITFSFLGKTLKYKTLTQYLVEQQREHAAVSADVRLLIETVSRACKAISHAVSKGALGGVLGSLGTENVQGEVQKKLDVLSNEILLEAN